MFLMVHYKCFLRHPGCMWWLLGARRDHCVVHAHHGAFLNTTNHTHKLTSSGLLDWIFLLHYQSFNFTIALHISIALSDSRK